MNTLKIEAKLAQKYSYKPLPKELSAKYREYFTENIPTFLHIQGSETPLYTLNDSLICDRYNRIVIGDYGAFIEFDRPADESHVVIQPGQEYRIHDPKYQKNVKYQWYTIKDGSNIKIYKQCRRVSYADYLPGKLYISVHEVKER